MSSEQPPLDPLIRLATATDLSTVQAIVHDAYRHYIARIGRAPGPMLDDYAALIAANTVHVLADARGLQGLIVLVPEPDALLIDNVAVRPGAQGHGYGRMLMSFADRSAMQAGLPAVRLYTHELMTENIALYRRYGFTETHRAEEHELPRVFMLKRLHQGSI